MKLQAVAFDVDGTLYPNPKMFARSALWALSNLKLLRAFAKTRVLLRTKRPIKDFYAEQAEMCAGFLKAPVSEVRRRLDTSIYTDWEKTLEGISIFPHLKETIQTFRDKGLKTAVLSDFPVANKLKLLGLTGLWDLELSSEEVGYLKPNPEAFLRICDTFHCKPEEVLYVGNSYSYDVLGAKNIGMQTAYLGKKPKKEPYPDINFTDYSVLCGYVLKNL